MIETKGLITTADLKLMFQNCTAGQQMKMLTHTHIHTCRQMRMQLQVKTFFLILHTEMKIWCPRLRGFSNFSDLRAMHFHIGKKEP